MQDGSTLKNKSYDRKMCLNLNLKKKHDFISGLKCAVKVETVLKTNGIFVFIPQITIVSPFVAHYINIWDWELSQN